MKKSYIITCMNFDIAYNFHKLGNLLFCKKRPRTHTFKLNQQHLHRHGMIDRWPCRSNRIIQRSRENFYRLSECSRTFGRQGLKDYDAIVGISTVFSVSHLEAFIFVIMGLVWPKGFQRLEYTLVLYLKY